MSDPSITAEIIGTGGVISVALIGAAVQLRALRKENKSQHDTNKNAVLDGFTAIETRIDERFDKVDDRLDRGDRRFDRIEDRMERELGRRKRWQR